MVIGLGRMGSALAITLERRGVSVLAIDTDLQAVQDIANEVPNVVQADATDIEALTQLDVDKTDVAVVAIGEDVEASILATSLLAELQIPHIWAKATTEQHGRILQRMGATHIVLPEQEAGERLAHLVVGSMQDYLAVDEDYAFVKTSPPRSLIGKTLTQAALRAQHGVTVVAVKRAGGTFTYATAETLLEDGDTLVVSGRIDDIDRFATDRSTTDP